MWLADLIFGKRTDDSASYKGAQVIRSAESPMFEGLSKIEGSQNRREALSKIVAKAR